MVGVSNQSAKGAVVLRAVPGYASAVRHSNTVSGTAEIAARNGTAIHGVERTENGGVRKLPTHKSSIFGPMFAGVK